VNDKPEPGYAVSAITAELPGAPQTRFFFGPFSDPDTATQIAGLQGSTIKRLSSEETRDRTIEVNGKEVNLISGPTLLGNSLMLQAATKQALVAHAKLPREAIGEVVCRAVAELGHQFFQETIPAILVYEILRDLPL
jgi:hypothetical protein